MSEVKSKKVKSLDELSFADQNVCQLLASLGVVFDTVELIKKEYNPDELDGYIGTRTCSQSVSYIVMLLSSNSYLY